MTRILTHLALTVATLAFALPAQAQDAPRATTLDELAPPDAPPAAQIFAKTGDAVLDRLNALEAEVNALKARNQALEGKLGATQARVETVEVRAAKEVEWSGGPSPTFNDPLGNFSLHPRGAIEADGSVFFSRKGGYDYSDGTQIRRARFGFDGVAFHDFPFRIEGEFVNNTASILDAYVSYTGFKHLTLLAGQVKVPFGLEPNTSDNFNTFTERGMFNNAFGAIGAERRIGFQAAYATEKFTATVSLNGENESVSRVSTAPGEGYGFNGRVTYEPINADGKLVHLGAAGYWRTQLGSGGVKDATRLTERPNAREDGGLIIDTGLIPSVADAHYVGGEGAFSYGRFGVQSEGGRLTVSRFGALSDLNYSGYYVFGSVFLTGETRPLKNGVLDRLKPINNFDPKAGTYGAFELAFRFDTLDAQDSPNAKNLGNRAESYTTALNWYFNPNIKLLLDWVRFYGRYTPLAVVGHDAQGDALTARVHLDF